MDAPETPPIAYDEFGLFHENADEFGIPWRGAPVVRRERVAVSPADDGTPRALSALVWGEGEPELVLLHGGSQNAHTWDTVALALDRPLVALDLPGHGHAADRRAGPFDRSGLRRFATDVALAVAVLAPRARLIVGMSLGGLTSIALAASHPDLVPELLLVDVTPGVDRGRAAPIVEFTSGPESFASFDEILARTLRYNPGRSYQSLRRGVLHNAAPRADGRWVWRHQRSAPATPARAADLDGEPRPDFGELWTDLAGIAVPITLARGMEAGSVVTDDEVERLHSLHPTARVVEFPGAGHSIQGDRPVELAALIAELLDT